ncbi:MAG: ABC transporter permease [Acidobacteria bacterium]|nr:ABC transporter permease [Acidobacteriota bacterium]
MNIVGLFDSLRQDVSYGLRTMRKQPVFALTAMVTLALGIGANTGIFTVVNAVLLRPLGYQDPDRLVRISGGATVARFEAIQRARSFAGVGTFQVFTNTVTLSNAEASEALKSVRVSTNFLSVLGVAPVAGRSFLREEETLGSAVAMISAALWSRRFSGDPAVVGTTVRLGGVPCTIVGVLPRSFQFPFPDVDVWMPWQPEAMPMQARLNSPVLAVLGRLNAGVSLQQASAEIAVVNRQYALTNRGKLDAKTDGPEPVVLFKDQLVRGVRSTLWMLTGAVGLVLAIACANIASLLLVRAQSRSREFAVRSALGAGRGRVTTQLLIESLLLALGGGTLGFVGAAWSLRGIEGMPGFELLRMGEIHLDGTVLGFAMALSIATGILFGLAPSLYGFRADLAEVLKGSGEAPFAVRSRRLLPIPVSPRSLLIVLQVAVSTVLLIGAALLIESVARLRRVDPGFNAENLLTMRLTLPPPSSGAASAVGPNFLELVERVESIPGVRNAAVTLTLPTTGFAGTPVYVVSQAPPQLNKRPIAVLQAVTPGYFRTMGIALRRGRDFAREDSAAAPKVVIINEAMARRFWPSYPGGEDPIGQSILAGASPDPLQIVGIVSDVRQAGLADGAAPGIYRPRAQTPPMSAMFAVRTSTDPSRVVNAIRAEVAAIDRDMSIAAVKSMTEVIDDSEGQRRGVMILLALFAAIGLLLTCVGTYGLIAYSVTARTREIGIRKALGARQGDVLRLVLGQGMALTVAGSMLGLCGALAFTRVLQSLLFEVDATDPSTFIGVAFLCVGVALLASYFPARRAMRIEPTAALRSDKT